MQSFRSKVIGRVIGLTATLSALSFGFFHLEYYLLIVVLVLLAIAQVFDLIRLVERTNRDVYRFLDSIAYSDFTQTFTPKNSGKTFDDLHRLFTDVLEKFRSVRTEGEEQRKYLEFVVQSVAAGLLCFDGKGDILLVNRAAKKMLGITHIRSLSELARLDHDLPEILFGMETGESVNQRISMESKNLQQFRFSASKFKLRGQSLTLIAFQNIQQELDEKELEAWQTLTKVLTHEIMNSMTPIATMSSALGSDLDAIEATQDSKFVLSQETFEDLKMALKTIGRRGGGLIDFVQRFRSLTQIDSPKFESVDVAKIIEDSIQLFSITIEESGIEINTEVNPESLKISADPTMIEQVLTNIIKNAIEAAQHVDEPKIRVRGFYDEKMRAVFEVIDNGGGIATSAIEKIFVPFFSTKKGGSGIGLSLARQIMRMHGGSLTVRSNSEEGTVFTLIF